MQTVKRYFQVLLIIGIIIIVMMSLINFYSIIFARRVKGVVDSVQKMELNVALMQTAANENLNPQLFSFAVAIKESTGEIVTASAEDRQWAVVKPGQCAEAVFYPYPPWQLNKANTYFGARLEKLTDCGPTGQ